jgi:hypothetical protein
MRKAKRKLLRALMAGAALMAVGSAQASLTSFYQFNGKGNWSIDAIGGNTTPVGIVQASVPVGSTVEKAFLYSSLWDVPTVPTVNFDGTVYSGAAWTPLGVNNGFLQAFRTDVTAQVAAKVGGGSGSRFDFSVNSESPTGDIDGEVLVVVYKNPAEVERTIAVLDGFSASGGDSTTINFSSPLTEVGNPGFEALLSLGIGFGHQPAGQFSIVDGDGRRLTSSAGGEDDGAGANGALITAGGLDDSPANPDPFAAATNPRTDDELYDLGQGNSADSNPFLSNGLLSYGFNTSNPSGDDNIFFMGLNITARAGVNQPPPPPPDGVPDAGSTALLLGLGVMGMAALRRK